MSNPRKSALARVRAVRRRHLVLDSPHEEEGVNDGDGGGSGYPYPSENYKEWVVDSEEFLDEELSVPILT